MSAIIFQIINFFDNSGTIILRKEDIGFKQSRIE